MLTIPEELKLIDGGRGAEQELPAHDDSPTWIVDEAWETVQEACRRALNAYMAYCREEGLPHSYLLGLDVLIMGTPDPENPRRVIDIRPTLVEGPCCNSYPACPNLDSYKLYRRMQLRGFEPDRVRYPVHPTRIREHIAQVFIDLWRRRGGEGMPSVGLFTRAYPESEEEAAHEAMLAGFREAGLDAHRITPEEGPEVRDGHIWVHGRPMHFCYRRIERIHVPVFYGERLGRRIIEETPNTQWVNPFEVDDLRSKTIEERAFRRWEAKTGIRISRPATLLGSEITVENVREFARLGGFVSKRWNSTGGKGVFLNAYLPQARQLCDYLYLRYDGRHMRLLEEDELEQELEMFRDFQEDAAIQLLRFPDARIIGPRERLVYDTRINCLYNVERGEWEFISGISRSVPCGPEVSNGNSLLTNITAGAEISPLVLGPTSDPGFRESLSFGPLLGALMDGRTELVF